MKPIGKLLKKILRIKSPSGELKRNAEPQILTVLSKWLPWALGYFKEKNDD